MTKQRLLFYAQYTRFLANSDKTHVDITDDIRYLYLTCRYLDYDGHFTKGDTTYCDLSDYRTQTEISDYSAFKEQVFITFISLHFLSIVNGMNAEQALRTAIVKVLFGFTYQELAFQIIDSKNIRCFCQIRIAYKGFKSQ